MEAQAEKTSGVANPDATVRVKIIGVGTAGALLVKALPLPEFAPASLAFVNTDASIPVGPQPQLLLTPQPLRGLGTGGDPELGRQLAEERYADLQAICAQTDVVFLLAGLGGGAGSGVTPVLARAAKESGALVLAFVTLPFACEGNRRQLQAQQALAELNGEADAAVCLANQKVLPLLNERATVLESFHAGAQLLIEAVRGAWRLLQRSGLVQLRFQDLCAVLRENHEASCFATVEAQGATRGPLVLEKILAHPLLAGGEAFTGATSMLVSIVGGSDLTMAEVDELMRKLSERCIGTRILMGATIDPAFQDRLSVTVFVACAAKAERAAAGGPDGQRKPAAATQLDVELLNPEDTTRPESRLEPAATPLTADQRATILTKQVGKSGRVRKRVASPRMKQTTLPLDLVSKGRFDKSEPTIHKGEDLDLPTYVRRGISLN